jgi:hypothetical protein
MIAKPSRANLFATALPIPRDAPVTMAHFVCVLAIVRSPFLPEQAVIHLRTLPVALLQEIRYIALIIRLMHC